MRYEFPPDVARLVEDCMAEGGYASADEVLRDALRTFRALADRVPATRAPASLRELRDAVRQGLAQLDRGESRDAESVFRDLLSEAPVHERT